MKSVKSLILAWFLALLVAPVTSLAANDLQTMLGIFKSPQGNDVLPANWREQVQASRQFEYAGLSSPKLFDRIEANLLRAYKGSAKSEAEYTAWMSKALGYSGQEKYLGTLQTVASGAPGKRTRGHADAAAELIPQYAQWNRIIASRDKYRSDKSADVNQYANMLRSGVPELQLLASKRISYEKNFDPLLVKLLDEQVRAGAPQEIDDKRHIDAMAWMTRMLAASGDRSYQPTVQMVAEQGGSKKLRRYAQKYLASYY